MLAPKGARTREAAGGRLSWAQAGGASITEGCMDFSRYICRGGFIWNPPMLGLEIWFMLLRELSVAPERKGSPEEIEELGTPVKRWRVSTACVGAETRNRMSNDSMYRAFMI